ncbi:hypothetical protein [Leifsonia xyli]|uniref:hypothetical protein n=1 Tax=Leifsonia xyli TaxID=1575 RepID=UPI003D66C6E7
MTEYSSLRELEDAQDQAVVVARRRLERAEEGVAYYRSQMARMQEDFHALAAREGAADDPGFRAALHRVSDITEAEVWEANRAVARLEEDLDELRTQQYTERELFLERQRDAR